MAFVAVCGFRRSLGTGKSLSFVSRLMYPCPSCHQRTISFLRKWWSHPIFPATCSSCGQFCVVPGSRSSGIFVALILIVTACGFLSAALKDGLPLVLGLLFSLLFYIWRWHLATLQHISPEAVASARTRENIFLAILALLGFTQ